MIKGIHNFGLLIISKKRPLVTYDNCLYSVHAIGLYNVKSHRKQKSSYDEGRSVCYKLSYKPNDNEGEKEKVRENSKISAYSSTFLVVIPR